MVDNYYTPELRNVLKKLSRFGIHSYDTNLNLYKYVTIETAEKILKTSTLKFSTPIELNDRDCELQLFNINLKKDFLFKEKKKSAKIALKQKGYNDTAIYEFFRTEAGKKFINHVPDETVLELYKQGYEEKKKLLGFLCLTTSPNNSKMWDKFGQQGKGVCIEYKFPTLFSDTHYGLKVHYEKEMLAYDMYDKNGTHKELPLLRWYFTKSVEYEFEDEVRIMSNVGEVGITPPLKNVFTGLYYGKATEQTDIEKLETTIKIVGYSFNKGKRVEY